MSAACAPADAVSFSFPLLLRELVVTVAALSLEAREESVQERVRHAWVVALFQSLKCKNTLVCKNKKIIRAGVSSGRLDVKLLCMRPEATSD